MKILFWYPVFFFSIYVYDVFLVFNLTDDTIQTYTHNPMYKFCFFCHLYKKLTHVISYLHLCILLKFKSPDKPLILYFIPETQQLWSAVLQ
jgi:hypothetical protein